jgi:hypothetical protein
MGGNTARRGHWGLKLGLFVVGVVGGMLSRSSTFSGLFYGFNKAFDFDAAYGKIVAGCCASPSSCCWFTAD